MGFTCDQVTLVERCIPAVEVEVVKRLTEIFLCECWIWLVAMPMRLQQQKQSNSICWVRVRLRQSPFRVISDPDYRHQWSPVEFSPQQIIQNLFLLSTQLFVFIRVGIYMRRTPFYVTLRLIMCTRNAQHFILSNRGTMYWRQRSHILFYITPCTRDRATHRQVAEKCPNFYDVTW